MNMRQCEVFRIVVETGSVTEAAHRLNVTQPAVSKIIAQLEHDLGFRAFLRERRRLIPTREAQALYNEVERAFVSLDYLTRFARDLKGLRQGHIVMGAYHSASSGWLPSIVAGFLRQHEGLSISLQTMDTPKITQAVASGHLDLGIVQFEVAARHVTREALMAVDAVCVLHPEHRLAKRRIIQLSDLQDEAFIALAAVNHLRTKLDAMLEAENVTRRIQVDTPLASTACALVMEGLGMTVIDRLSAEDNLYRGIVIRRFAPALSETLDLITSARRPATLITEEFIKALRTRFKKPAKI